MIFNNLVVKGIGVGTALLMTGGAGIALLQPGGPAQEGERPRAPVAMAIMREINEQTGLERCEVLSQLAEGQTATQVIEGAGGDPQAVADAALAAAQERIDTAEAEGKITQQQADELAERIALRVEEIMTTANGELAQKVYDRACGENRPPRLQIAAAIGEAVTEETGLERCDILAALAEGQTMAGILEGAGGDSEAVVQTVLGQVDERLEQAVADGNMTAERADELRTKAEERIRKAMETANPERAQQAYDNFCTAAPEADA